MDSVGTFLVFHKTHARIMEDEEEPRPPIRECSRRREANGGMMSLEAPWAFLEDTERGSGRVLRAVADRSKRSTAMLRAPMGDRREYVSAPPFLEGKGEGFEFQ